MLYSSKKSSDMKLLIWHMKVCSSNFATSNQSNITFQMKKFLPLFLLFLAIAFQSVAKESTGNSSYKTVGLHFQQKATTTPKAHRAPMHINLEVFYNVENNTVEIEYDGENDGEVFIYLNNNLISYDSTINTSIQIPATSGIYRIEIVSEIWVAYGSIQL